MWPLPVYQDSWKRRLLRVSFKTFIFHRVKLARHSETGAMVALKIMKNSGFDTGMMELVKNEIGAMKDLDHQSLVKLIDFNEDAKYVKPNGTQVDVFYLALELVSGGELFDFIAETGRFSEEVARYYFHQMIEGLEYMHTQGISHRDIKPENMMLDVNHNLKIADFGFSSSQAMNETKRGTDGYMAPEIYKGVRYSGQSVDLFATAIILFIMVAQHPPFNAASARDPHYKLLSTNRVDVFWKVHTKRKEGGLDFFSEDFRDLVSSMLSYIPHERPSLAEIKSHPWYNGPLPTPEQITEEFDQRSASLAAANNQETEAIPEYAVGAGAFQAHTVQRSIGGGEESKAIDIERTLAEYIPELKRYTEFYSTSSVDELFKTIASFGEDFAESYSFDDEEYRTSLVIKNDDESVELSVSVLKIDENKKCIEVIKEKGDKFEFYEAYKKIKKFFGGHANATL